MPSRPPGRSTRRSSPSDRSRSATFRTPKPTVAASNDASSKGSSRRSPRTHSIDFDFRRARSSIRSEKSSPTTRPPARSSASARSPVPQQASSTRSPGRTTDRAVSRRQRPSSPAVMTRFIKSYTGAIRSNIVRTASGGRTPLWTLTSRPPAGERFDRSFQTAARAKPVRPERDIASDVSRLTPTRNERVLDAELIEAACDDEVDEVVHRVGAVVEAGRREEHDRAGLPQPEHVLEVDRRERRLPRHQHQLAPFLQSHARRAVDQVGHRPGGHGAERA